MLTSENVKRLPDAYKKTQDSNNAKLLSINERIIERLEAVLEQVDNSADIYQATGITLDYYGDIVGQRRGNLNNEKFRLMILSRVAVNTSGVDYVTIMDNVIRILGCNLEDVSIIEMQDHDEPATLKVTAFPYEILGRAGFTSRQAVEMIGRLMPIGVKLIAQELQGTFEFAEFENEYDAKRGFGNIEQTIGGTLGMIVGEDEIGDPLPIY
jgi:hypothetical protein